MNHERHLIVTAIGLRDDMATLAIFLSRVEKRVIDEVVLAVDADEKILEI